MTRKRHIRAVAADDASPEDATAIERDEALESFEDSPPWDEEEWPQETAPRRTATWLLPVLFALAIAGWTGFFGYAYRGEMLLGAVPQQWVAWIAAWAVPVLLVLAVWLLALRSSTREAARFGDAAGLLTRESERLEARLLTVNRELSLAREFLTAQTRELDFLGRTAGDRLSEHADRLQGLIRDNGQQVDAIAGVSAHALENMDKLRGDLPVIANSARDVSNQIGSAGRGAKTQLDELVAGFERLNTFGEASERQVESLRERVDGVLDQLGARLDQIEGASAARLSAIGRDSEALRADLDTREVGALAAIHGRAEALRSELRDLADAHQADENGALAAMRERIAHLREEAENTTGRIRAGEESAVAAWGNQVEQLRDRLTRIIEEVTRIDAQSLENSQRKLRSLVEEAEGVDARLAERDEHFHARLIDRREAVAVLEEEATAALTERLVRFDAELAARREGQVAHLDELARRGEQMGARIEELGQRIEAARDLGTEAGTALADDLAVLRDTLAESRSSLTGTDEAVASLTNASVRLLELIKAGSAHASEDLPASIAGFAATLADVERRTESLRVALGDAERSGTALAGTVDAAEDRSRAAIGSLDEFANGLSGTIASQAEGLDRLAGKLREIDGENARIADRAQGELRDAIGALRQEASGALGDLDQAHAARIRSLAERVGEASARAIDDAVEARAAEAIGALDEAASRATEASREAALQLRDQLAKVNELAGNIETRVARARERAEEQVDNDFSRRVALITESLNSNAIDIGKALSTEVTDTAWTAYLRGDRGIFTRRAVRLLDNTQARDIAELFDSDGDFREHVSRYIHDFEAMLRMLLSTRDGHALGVTVLSSDIGKLYVTMAQAIERLRE